MSTPASGQQELRERIARELWEISEDGYEAQAMDYPHKRKSWVTRDQHDRSKFLLRAARILALLAPSPAPRKATDEDVAWVEDEVGSGSGGWDCVGPVTLLTAAFARGAAPSPASQQDTQRLDWLEKHDGLYAFYDPDQHEKLRFACLVSGGAEIYGDTPRAAIDSAMAATGQEEDK